MTMTNSNFIRQIIDTVIITTNNIIQGWYVGDTC